MVINFQSGDWLLFSNLRVTVLNKDTILCMHADGSAKGRYRPQSEFGVTKNERVREVGENNLKK